MSLKSKAKKAMALISEAGDFCATHLAEMTAIELNHDEWLDDPDHWIWEVALEI